jgi:hypothetical protein
VQLRQDVQILQLKLLLILRLHVLHGVQLQHIPVHVLHVEQISSCSKWSKQPLHLTHLQCFLHCMQLLQGTVDIGTSHPQYNLRFCSEDAAPVLQTGIIWLLWFGVKRKEHSGLNGSVAYLFTTH